MKDIKLMQLRNNHFSETVKDYGVYLVEIYSYFIDGKHWFTGLIKVNYVDIFVTKSDDASKIIHKLKDAMFGFTGISNIEVNNTTCQKQYFHAPCVYDIFLSSYGPHGYISVHNTSILEVSNFDHNNVEATIYCLEVGLNKLIKEVRVETSIVDAQRYVDLDHLLFYACRDGNLDIVRYLIGKGANINSSNHEGRTPLMHAAESNNLDIVKHLIINKANINAGGGTYKVWTALMKASYWGYLDIVKHLVNNGADVNAKNSLERTALAVAGFHDRTKVERYLKSKGAKI